MAASRTLSSASPSICARPDRRAFCSLSLKPVPPAEVSNIRPTAVAHADLTAGDLSIRRLRKLWYAAAWTTAKGLGDTGVSGRLSDVTVFEADSILGKG